MGKTLERRCALFYRYGCQNVHTWSVAKEDSTVGSGRIKDWNWSEAELYGVQVGTPAEFGSSVFAKFVQLGDHRLRELLLVRRKAGGT